MAAPGSRTMPEHVTAHVATADGPQPSELHDLAKSVKVNDLEI
jgi:hypothetical protein